VERRRLDINDQHPLLPSAVPAAASEAATASAGSRSLGRALPPPSKGCRLLRRGRWLKGIAPRAEWSVPCAGRCPAGTWAASTMLLASVPPLQRGPCEPTTICVTEDCPRAMMRRQNWCGLPCLL